MGQGSRPAVKRRGVAKKRLRIKIKIPCIFVGDKKLWERFFNLFKNYISSTYFDKLNKY